MARKAFRLKLPGLGKLSLNSTTTWMYAGIGTLALLAYLAYSGKKTGFGPLDTASDQFEGLYEDYIGPFPSMPGMGGAGPVPATPMQTAPVVPSAGAATRGMSFDDMVFSGAYAVDAPLPYTDWWNNDISDDDRIIIA